MLLGKRPRLGMRRTTSMSGISINIPESADCSEQSDQIMIFRDPDHQPVPFRNFHNNGRKISNIDSTCSNNYVYYSISHRQEAVDNNRFLATMVSPRPINGRNSAEFLTTCGRCKRRLAAGKDIYMYRGDTAFCSQECREKQMKKDERKEKCSSVVTASNKEDRHAHASSSSRKSENVAAG